jgi:hypothetical protein
MLLAYMSDGDTQKEPKIEDSLGSPVHDGREMLGDR